MQTFLPYPDFTASAQALDYRRLGKQRVEAKQIITILDGQTESPAWRNHPAVRMWVGYVNALKHYFNVVSWEWVGRGYRHTMGFYLPDGLVMPTWFGDEMFHRSHQSNLVRKMPGYYGIQFPDVPDNLPYIWPVGLGNKKEKNIK